MEPKDKTSEFTLDRREMLKTMGAAAIGMAAAGVTSAEAAEGQLTAPGEHNAYGAPPGTGISMSVSSHDAGKKMERSGKKRSS